VAVVRLAVSLPREPRRELVERYDPAIWRKFECVAVVEPEVSNGGPPEGL
jgi:hypothetical protein